MQCICSLKFTPTSNSKSTYIRRIYGYLGMFVLELNGVNASFTVPAIENQRLNPPPAQAIYLYNPIRIEISFHCSIFNHFCVSVYVIDSPEVFGQVVSGALDAWQNISFSDGWSLFWLRVELLYSVVKSESMLSFFVVCIFLMVSYTYCEWLSKNQF